MWLNNPGEEKILQEEAEARRNALAHGSEQERVQALEGIAAGQQSATTEESDFEQFHRMQNITRAQNRFLAAHPEYANVYSNTQAFGRWFQERGIEEPTLSLYEDAYADLASRHGLQLKGAPKNVKTGAYIEDLSAEGVYEEYQKATEQAAAEEAEDRAIFEKSEARGGFRWLREHPDFIQCPENIAAFQLYFNARRIDLNRASVEQIEEAYQALKTELKLDPSKAKSAAPESEQSLYDLPLDELERRAGGHQTDGRQTEPDTYVPDPLVRYRINSQF